MRFYAVLAGSTMLAACSGGGASTVVSTPPPAAGVPGEPAHSMVNPKEAKTYVGVGANQVYEYLTDDRECCNQQAQKFAGMASSVRDSKVTIAYDPRDAIFTLTVKDPLTGADARVRFQDPASRTDFGGTQEPQWGTPKLDNPNFSYLQAGDGSPLSSYENSGSGTIYYLGNGEPVNGDPGSSYQATSLFVLKPGAVTKYVTFAGYARNSFEFQDQDVSGVITNIMKSHLERGAFAFGELTENSKVPKSGSGTYSGLMLGSMVFNPTIDGQDAGGTGVLPSYFQWIEGTSSLSVDFATNMFQLALQGTVLAPMIDRYTGPETSVLGGGSTFRANGKGSINMINFGGFKGSMDSASFTPSDGSPQRSINIAGSSIDGAFYGPNGEEAGGGFRVVGGNPDERIDVVGAFSGKK
jgi:hypothetical protein